MQLDQIVVDGVEVAVQSPNGVWHVRHPTEERWIPCVYKEDAQEQVVKLYPNN